MVRTSCGKSALFLVITYISHKYNVLVRLCSASLHLNLAHRVMSQVLVLSRWRDRNVV
jgi:hypothetical protein